MSCAAAKSFLMKRMYHRGAHGSDKEMCEASSDLSKPAARHSCGNHLSKRMSARYLASARRWWRSLKSMLDVQWLKATISAMSRDKHRVVVVMAGACMLSQQSSAASKASSGAVKNIPARKSVAARRHRRASRAWSPSARRNGARGNNGEQSVHISGR